MFQKTISSSVEENFISSLVQTSHQIISDKYHCLPGLMYDTEIYRTWKSILYSNFQSYIRISNDTDLFEMLCNDYCDYRYISGIFSTYKRILFFKLLAHS